jgi:hypothetical protein
LFELNYNLKKNSNFVHVYFYEERELEFETDKNTDFSSNFEELESSNKPFGEEAKIWKEQLVGIKDYRFIIPILRK